MKDHPDETPSLLLNNAPSYFRIDEIFRDLFSPNPFDVTSM